MTIKEKEEAFYLFLKDKLTYPAMADMDFKKYKVLVVDVFNRLNDLKSLGVNEEEIKDFINKYYYAVMGFEEDEDVLFERRFSAITEEIVEFCPNPFFWDTDFDIYMKKWDKFFQMDWLKKV
jgi:hypothetical protein